MKKFQLSSLTTLGLSLALVYLAGCKKIEDLLPRAEKKDPYEIIPGLKKAPATEDGKSEAENEPASGNDSKNRR